MQCNAVMAFLYIHIIILFFPDFALTWPFQLSFVNKTKTVDGFCLPILISVPYFNSNSKLNENPNDFDEQQQKK